MCPAKLNTTLYNAKSNKNATLGKRLQKTKALKTKILMVAANQGYATLGATQHKDKSNIFWTLGHINIASPTERNILVSKDWCSKIIFAKRSFLLNAS